MVTLPRITRRDCLKFMGAATVCGSMAARGAATGNIGTEAKRLAGVITHYRKNSHADVLLSKILEGWKQDGGPGPALKLVAMYVDQFPKGDLARTMAAKHNVAIFDTIEGAVTVGGPRIDVDGVLSIGEHGDYPWNDKGQHLYPRRRFFEEITATFEKYDRVVPVFSDKHLGPVWTDAKWMYDRARQLNVPLMAGSSLPLSFRTPEISLPMGCRIDGMVAVGYSGLDVYGIHTLEAFQSLAERRRDAESGVQWVQCLQGEAMWRAVDEGRVNSELLRAALRATETKQNAEMRRATGDDAALFMFQYNDGLLGTVLMLPGYVQGVSVAIRLKGQPTPLATRFEERSEPAYPHFAYLLKAIERMIHTGRPSYPVERTLLTAGLLDRLLTSRVQQHRQLTTPELAIEYTPVDYPHAPSPSLIPAATQG